jgi:histidinol dehydrogenase
MMLSVVAAADRAHALGARTPARVPSPELTASVAEVLAGVRTRGDAALVEYTRAYDDPQYGAAGLRVPVPMHDSARSLVPPEIAQALRLAKERIERFTERQRPQEQNYVDADGTRMGLRYRPFEAVAAYAHGGRAGAVAVLMNAIPARIAGVGRTIVLCAPHAGGVHPAVLFACSLCDVDELYAVGGPQAIAAAAYGTESIARVEKIVGWGGALVTEAKRQVYGLCDVDALAGPPDLVIVADDGASSEYVAGEVLAQAERDAFARVTVISESRPLLDAIAQLLDTFDVRSVEGACDLLHAAHREELFATIDALAPACLALHVRDAEPYLGRIRGIGTVLVGDMSPIASMFLAGASPVRYEDFVRGFSVVENSRERMLGDAQPLAALCDYEYLPYHAQTARMRNGA